MATPTTPYSLRKRSQRTSRYGEEAVMLEPYKPHRRTPMRLLKETASTAATTSDAEPKGRVEISSPSTEESSEVDSLPAAAPSPSEEIQGLMEGMSPRRIVRTKTPRPHTKHFHDLQPYIEETDTFVSSLYKPHTVSVLMIVIGCLLVAMYTRGDTSLSSNVVTGLTGGCMVFLAFCATHLHDGELMRPHPAVWRIVQGITVLYMMVLVFALFQDVDDVRQWLKHIDPTLGVSLPEKAYAADCSVTFDTWKHVFDEFIIAHLFGNMAKAILLRDFWLCWTISISFELTELTFQHHLENFKECWWDHVVLDVLGANALGIWMGMKVCEYFEMKDYRWIRVDQLSSKGAKLRRALTQFTPFGWTKYRWNIYRSNKRFLIACLIVIGVNLYEVNVFFLKYLLWIPPTNPLVTLRLCLSLFPNFPAVAELYKYMDDPTCKRLGTNTWLSLMIMTLETFIIFNWSKGHFPNRWPPNIVYPWLAFLALFLAWYFMHFFVLRFHRYLRHRRQQKAARKRNVRPHHVTAEVELMEDGYASDDSGTEAEFNAETDDYAPQKYAFLDILYYVSFIPLVFLFFSACPQLESGQHWFNTWIDPTFYEVANATVSG